ncbi:hypothetical protein [Chitinilyticum piscinae]|uniref:Uncharacterized protein n=1 Tax=Chitinilyticum piscinae TaxID=2866724 RepID=A0A8J7FK85_9NEIS|nr:hypothetical protein [Chitinilyticum piscinae]MBE9609497.1 hypothetical protein [Chitinilyticum piscinae]
MNDVLEVLFRFRIVRVKTGMVEATVFGRDPEAVLADYVAREELPANARTYLAVRRAGRCAEFERHGYRFRLLADCSQDGAHQTENTLIRIAIDRFKRLTPDEETAHNVFEGLPIYHPNVAFCADAGRVLAMLDELLVHYQRKGIWEFLLDVSEAAV